MDADVRRPILYGGEALRTEVHHVSGGGPKFHPLTVEAAREALLPRITALRSVERELPERLRGRRVVIEAPILPNYLAASHFPDQLLSFSGLEILGTRPASARYQTQSTDEERPTKSLILAASGAALARLEALAAGPARSRTEIAAQETLRRLADIRLPLARDVLRVPADTDYDEDVVLFEAVLHPDVDIFGRLEPVAGGPLFQKWVSFVRSLGGEVDTRYERAVGPLTFVPVRLPPDRLPDTARFNPLRAIRPMPRLRRITSARLRSLPEYRVADPPRWDAIPSSEERIAVFDGGVDPTNPFLGPYVTARDLTPAAADSQYVAHGTIVSLASLHGLMKVDRPLSRPHAYVDHYRVLPVPAAHDDEDMNWVLDRILEVLRLGDHRIVNLSLGPELPVDDHEPHRWTAELDAIAREMDIAVVVAAGNNGTEDSALGMDRVLVPGDMVNGITVGACDEHEPDRGWQRCDYSALGPGRSGARIKPTGLAFGGRAPDRPFVSVLSDGTWAAVDEEGTSYAAPLVAHGISEVLTSGLPVRSAANLLRAFAVQFADAPPNGTVVEEAGYGRLRWDYEDALSCGRDEVTVVFQDSLARDETIALPIPLPEVGGNVEIRWTLAITSPVAPEDAVEYTRAGFELQFRPHSRKVPFTLPDQSIQIVDVHADRARALTLLSSGARMSPNPATRSAATIRASELSRRDEGKWETILHARHRMRASSLHEPRIDLAYFMRDGNLVGASMSPDMDFALVVTLRARAGSDLYDRVRAEYPVLAPVRLEGRVRATTA